MCQVRDSGKGVTVIELSIHRLAGIKSLRPMVVFGETLYPLEKRWNDHYIVRKLVKHYRTAGGQEIWEWEYVVMDSTGLVTYCTNRELAKMYVGKVRFTGLEEALKEYGGKS